MICAISRLRGLWGIGNERSLDAGHSDIAHVALPLQEMPHDHAGGEQPRP